MQERPATTSRSVRLTEQDKEDIEAIVASGWARTTSQALSWALRVARKTLKDEAEREVTA